MIFKEDYYLNSKKSNYTDYLSKDFKGLSKDISKYIEMNSVTLDFGCATGGLVYELNNLGYKTIGTDISYWAINTGRKKYLLDKDILQHHNITLLENKYIDNMIVLDVFEHIEEEEIKELLSICSIRNMIVRIPVSIIEGEDYYLDVSKKDITHKKAHTKKWWQNLFFFFGYNVKNIINEKYIYDSMGVLCVKIIKYQ